jgi:putative FmdB family regulatory protein
MPIYEYESETGEIIEIWQKISELPLECCPETGKKIKRIISRNSFKLNGTGWYKTDYANKNSTGESGSKSNATKSTTENTNVTTSTTDSTSSSNTTSTSSHSCGSTCGC